MVHGKKPRKFQESLKTPNFKKSVPLPVFKNLVLKLLI